MARLGQGQPVSARVGVKVWQQDCSWEACGWMGGRSQRAVCQEAGPNGVGRSLGQAGSWRGPTSGSGRRWGLTRRSGGGRKWLTARPRVSHGKQRPRGTEEVRRGEKAREAGGRKETSQREQLQGRDLSTRL